MADLGMLYRRSHIRNINMTWHPDNISGDMVNGIGSVTANDIYTYSLDILCLMALTEALGLEYGDCMKNLGC